MLGRDPPKGLAALVFGMIVLGGVSLPAAPADLGTIRTDLELGRYSRAEADARTLLAVVEAGRDPDPSRVADVLDVLVESIRYNGTFMGSDARALAERAVVLRESRAGPDAPEVAGSLRNLADLLFLRAEFAEAERLYERAIGILRSHSPSDRVEIATTLACFARLTWVWRGRHDLAAELFREAASTLERELDPSDPRLAATLAMWGDQQREAGDYEVSHESLRRALEIREQTLGPNHPETAMSRVLLARLLYTLDRLQEALALQEAAQPILESTLGARHPEYALALVRWGLSIWSTESRFDEALETFDRATGILEASVGLGHPWVATALNYRGNISSILGDAMHARMYLERALAIRDATLGPDHPSTAMSANNLGLFHKEMLDYDNADRLFSRAARTWDSVLGAGHYLAEGVHANIGEVRMLEGDLEGAEMPLRRALRGLSDALGADNRHVAYVTSQLGKWTLLRGDDPDEARRLLQQALDILERESSPNGFDLANTMSDLASLLERDPEERPRAYALHQRALSIRRKVLGPDHPAVRFSFEGLARLAALDGDLARARDLAFQAEDIRREHLLLTARLASERDALRLSWRGTAGLDLALSLTPVEGEAVTIAWDRVTRSRALVFDELAKRQQEIAGTRDPGVERLVQRLETHRARLSNLLLRGLTSSQPADYRARVEQVRSENDDVERELAALSVEFRNEREQRLVGFEQVRSSLPSDMALVAYVRYTQMTDSDAQSVPHYLALVLPTSGSEPTLIRLGDAETIDRRVDAWMNDLSTPPPLLTPGTRRAEQDCRESGHALRSLIWNPVVAHVPSGHGVLIIPDGSLHLVNFAALPANDGTYLLEERPGIHLLSSEKDLTAPPGDRTGEGLLVAGDPEYDGSAANATGSDLANVLDRERPADRVVLRGSPGTCPELASVRFEPLPGTRKEVADVVALWRECVRSSGGRCSGGAVDLLGSRANETTVKQEASGKRVIHLATHGFFSGGVCTTADNGARVAASVQGGPGSLIPLLRNPMNLSGLAFTGANRSADAPDDQDDGVLTAGEVAALDLTGVEWAVLSGCDTGRGDVLPGEGVLGFRRAFRLAGVRTVLMTLWPVQDEIARDWVQGLYVARARGSSTAESVRQASLGILHARRESGESTHPFFWGAFVAEGDWR